MQFLSPWMLWGLAAVSVPILIHLWQRRQVVPLPFSTLKYLKVVAARTSRSAKLENLLLLLLRCLVFALLALAAARPVVSKKALRLLGGNVQRTVVFVVDRSMSMGYRNGEKTRLGVARDEALSVLDSLKPGDEAAVLAADAGVQALVAEPTLDRGALHGALSGVKASEEATNFSLRWWRRGRFLPDRTSPCMRFTCSRTIRRADGNSIQRWCSTTLGRRRR